MSGSSQSLRTSEGQAGAKKSGPSFGFMDVVWFLPRLVYRLFFPKLVDRYVLGELIAPLVFGWTMFIVLFVFSLYLFKLVQMAARGAPLAYVGELLWLRVVLSTVYCLPMAMLLAGLLAFGRMSGDSELIATQASGVPNLRIIRNAFVLGLVISVAGLALNEYVVPPAGKRLHEVQTKVQTLLKGQIISDLTDQKAFIIQDMEKGRLARLVAAKSFEPEEKPRPALMRDVTYIQYDDKGEWNTIVQATRAEWLNQQEWRFYDADTQFRRGVTGRGRQLYWRAATMDLELKKTPEQAKREQKDADQMSYRELRDYITELKKQRVKGRVIRELRVEMERKLAVPFTALVLALIGAPLGIRKQRSTAGVGIGLSLLIIIFFYMGMGFLAALGQNGQITPLEAAWGCNVVGLLVGLFLTWRSSG